jgi:hypothetical protein
MLSFGITRGQFATGLIAAGALISAGFSALASTISGVMGKFAPADLPKAFLLAFSFWLFGWFAVIGFQYLNVFTAAASVTLSVFLIYATIRYAYVEQLLGTWDVSSAHFTFTAPSAAIFAAADVLMAAVLRFLTKHIPVSC